MLLRKLLLQKLSLFTTLAHILGLKALKSFVFKSPTIGDPSTLLHC